VIGLSTTVTGEIVECTINFGELLLKFIIFALLFVGVVLGVVLGVVSGVVEILRAAILEATDEEPRIFELVVVVVVVVVMEVAVVVVVAVVAVIVVVVVVMAVYEGTIVAVKAGVILTSASGVDSIESCLLVMGVTSGPFVRSLATSASFTSFITPASASPTGTSVSVGMAEVWVAVEAEAGAGSEAEEGSATAAAAIGWTVQSGGEGMSGGVRRSV
jgi:hypothetical protein